MLVTKKINNNVALARDAAGNEVVIFGKGVGFPSTPYELDDTSRLQRIFRYIEGDVADSLANISPDIIEVSLEFVDFAAHELNCTLRPNVFITLADHLQFAIEREKGGITFSHPLEHEITLVYAREYEVATRCLAMLAERGYNLSKNEACSIALYIANAEAIGNTFTDDFRGTMQIVRVVDEIIAIVEEQLATTINRSTYSFSRFVIHIRYLARRLIDGDPIEPQNFSMYEQLAADFPEAHTCAEAIRLYLKQEYGWECSDEEVVYLMMYINRLFSGL